MNRAGATRVSTILRVFYRVAEITIVFVIMLAALDASAHDFHGISNALPAIHLLPDQRAAYSVRTNSTAITTCT
jgi:hypothetical protein